MMNNIMSIGIDIFFNEITEHLISISRMQYAVSN